jgi:hypothetical protein
MAGGSLHAAVQTVAHHRPAGITVQLQKSTTSRPLTALTLRSPWFDLEQHDRFSLAVGVDGMTTQWELFFAGSTGAAPPDFIFLTDPTFCPDPATLPTLQSWAERSIADSMVGWPATVSTHHSLQARTSTPPIRGGSCMAPTALVVRKAAACAASVAVMP